MKSIFDEEDDEYIEEMRNKRWLDVAQICQNGHVINSATRDSPGFNKKFCDRCGESTMTQCPRCNQDIPGAYHFPNVTVLGPIVDEPAPSFCSHCGEAYPWTQTKLQAAQDLVSEMENLDVEERKLLTDGMDDLVKDNPRTPVAVTRYKKLATKIGVDGASMLKDILVDIVSTTAKKMLWP